MATWTRAGTAALTNGSTAVTFTGVNLLTANVRIGDALHAPDGRAYEIATVDSSTVVTLAEAYLGSTASGQTYAIQPTRGIVTSLYDTLQSVIASFQSHLDGILAGLFPAGTPGAPSIAKAGDTNTGLYWPAADQIAAATNGVRRWLLSTTAFQVDVPITGTAVQSSATDTTADSLLKMGGDSSFGPFGLGGLVRNNIADLDATDTRAGFYGFIITTPNVASRPAGAGEFGYVLVERYSATALKQTLSDTSTSSGTWVRHYSGGVWGTWREIYNADTILGTVSQTGGVPTGAVIEQASNANGRYTRWADGTQICHATLTASNSGTQTWTFPAAFSIAPNVSISPGGTLARFTGFSSLDATTAGFDAWAADGTTRVAINTRIIAVGRWF